MPATTEPQTPYQPQPTAPRLNRTQPTTAAQPGPTQHQPTGQPTTPGQVQPTAQETRRPTAPQPSKGLIAKPIPSANQAPRTAPDTTAGPLRFTRIQVNTTTPGKLTVQANVTNTSPGYLNATTITWRAIDAQGTTLSTGNTKLTLAPAETTTLRQQAPAQPGKWSKLTFHLT